MPCTPHLKDTTSGLSLVLALNIDVAALCYQKNMAVLW